MILIPQIISQKISCGRYVYLLKKIKVCFGKIQNIQLGFINLTRENYENSYCDKICEFHSIWDKLVYRLSGNSGCE